jgi:hypothetical protein
MGIAQRQTLGPLHVHAPAPTQAEGGHTAATLLHSALDWWWAQVQAQSKAREHARAHADARAHAHAPAYARAPARADDEAVAHAHDAWQRHRHGPQDSTVIALDAVAETLDAQGAAASLLLPVLGAPVGGLRMAAAKAWHRAWPRVAGARIRSWGIAPPLPPPRG